MLTLGGAIRLEGEGEQAPVVNGSELELRDAILIDSAGDGSASRALAGHDQAGCVRRDRRAGRPEAAGTGRMPGPGPDPNPFLDALRTTLGAASEEPGRAPPGRLGGEDDRRAGDRAAGRPPAGVHRGAGPSAQRAAAQARRPALQPAGPGNGRGRAARLDMEIETAPGGAGRRLTRGQGARRPRRASLASGKDPSGQDELTRHVTNDGSRRRRSIHDRGDPLHQDVTAISSPSTT